MCKVVARVCGTETYDDVKPVRVALLQGVPLWLGVLPIQLNIFVRAVQPLGCIHLDTLVGGYHDPGRAVDFEQLCENETRRTGAYDKGGDSCDGFESVNTTDSARSRLDQGGLLIGDVVDLVQSLGVAVEECKQSAFQGQT